MSDIYPVLVAELRLAEYTGIDDAAALAHLQSKTVSVRWGISWSDLATWAAGNGVRAKLQVGADNTATDAQSVAIRGMCLTVIDRFRQPLDTTMLDLSNGATALFDALVTAGILTAAQKAELITMGTVAQPYAPWAANVAVGNITSARKMIAGGA